MGSKLTLISAPAGFGKTTLVSEWIAGFGRRAAWLSLGVLLFCKDKSLSRSTYLILILIGFGLVLNVAAVSVLSLPTPMQVFAADDTWITRAPFIWLSTFLVQLAIAGHILSFRKLLMERKTHPTIELAKAQSFQ